jgi:2,3-bisphosphoglycerate-dependent phosphoglycerate mutase
MKRLLTALFVLISLATYSQTTIILVRHAEKGDSDPRDPDLSANGKERVAALTRMLSEVEFDEVYTTPYKRTRQTVTPLAVKQGREVQEYNPSAQEAFATMLKSKEGQTILIAGHSNTIPGLVNYLIGERKFENLPEEEFDNVFIVTIADKGSKAVRLKFGN